MTENTVQPLSDEEWDTLKRALTCGAAPRFVETAVELFDATITDLKERLAEAQERESRAILLSQNDAVRVASAEQENKRLIEVVVKCAATFREYAELHRAKKTPEGDEKARRNEELMTMCACAAALSPQPVTEQT